MNASSTAAGLDLGDYEKIALILAQELPSLPLNAEPLEVVDSLENLSEEMALMPDIIRDCRLAAEALEDFDAVVGRMYALADRAAEAPEELDRRTLDEEFKGHAHILARLAGEDDFDGPALRLVSKAEAQAARRILGYIVDARAGFKRQLARQRRQINDAMDEAVALLARLAEEGEYLSLESRGRLEGILERLTGFEKPEGTATPPGRWLH